MLSAAEQLVDRSQTRAVADALKWLQARLKQHPQQQQGGKTLRQWLEELDAAFDQQVLPSMLHGWLNAIWRQLANGLLCALCAAPHLLMDDTVCVASTQVWPKLERSPILLARGGGDGCTC